MVQYTRFFFLLFHGNAILGYKFLFNSSSCKITATSRLGRAARYFFLFKPKKKEKQEIPKLCAFHFARVCICLWRKLKYEHIATCRLVAFFIFVGLEWMRAECARGNEYGWWNVAGNERWFDLRFNWTDSHHSGLFALHFKLVSLAECRLHLHEPKKGHVASGDLRPNHRLSSF